MLAHELDEQLDDNDLSQHEKIAVAVSENEKKLTNGTLSSNPVKKSNFFIQNLYINTYDNHIIHFFL